MACPARQYFSTFSHTRHDFLKKKSLWDIKWVFWYFLQILSETFPILQRSEWDMTTYVHCSSCKVPLFLSDFNATWVFLTVLRKIPKCQISGKSVQWKPSFCVPTYGRTDGQDDVKSHFSQFCEHAWKCKRTRDINKVAPFFLLHKCHGTNTLTQSTVVSYPVKFH